MRIGLDFDGVICRQVYWPRWMPKQMRICLRLLIFPMPGLKVARKLCREHQVVVVTCRNEDFRLVTRWWLRFHRLPVAGLHCIGWGNDKGVILKQDQVEVFFDNHQRHVDAVVRQGVPAFLFTSWAEVEKQLKCFATAQEENE